jgi:hypothetical protein
MTSFSSSFVALHRFLCSNADEQKAVQTECAQRLDALGARRTEALQAFVASLPDVLYLLTWRANDNRRAHGIYTSVHLAQKYARDPRVVGRKDVEIVVKQPTDLVNLYGFTLGQIPVDMEPRLE